MSLLDKNVALYNCVKCCCEEYLIHFSWNRFLTSWFPWEPIVAAKENGKDNKRKGVEKGKRTSFGKEKRNTCILSWNIQLQLLSSEPVWQFLASIFCMLVFQRVIWKFVIWHFEMMKLYAGSLSEKWKDMTLYLSFEINYGVD